jgi:hypothetical protein
MYKYKYKYWSKYGPVELGGIKEEEEEMDGDGVVSQ